ncbi:hypothetical protein [Acinetobacter sp. MB5]|uniref:hypothetical protein n=1 Tax=Acinetobacter sp. MB5 TaxID=2069438 RepID=UPI000DD0974E|nr:hypothetical protein [Acinetobacter sp. MB5]
MMIEQQRQQLAMMGIDLWVPRAAVVRSVTSAAKLWRDVDIGQTVEQQIAPQQVNIDAVSNIKSVVNQAASQEIILDKINTQVAVEQDLKPSPVGPEINITIDAVEAFQLQALVAEQFVLLTDHTALTAETLPLWRNIQQALVLQDAVLQWPFPVPSLQDASGLGDYVQGFFDVIAAEKTIFCLGDLPTGLTLELEHVASLADMLQQPLLKQQLWKLIQQLRL